MFPISHQAPSSSTDSDNADRCYRAQRRKKTGSASGPPPRHVRLPIPQGAIRAATIRTTRTTRQGPITGRVVAVPGRQELPSTLQRSSKKAQRTWIEAHDSAVKTYGEGRRAHQTAFAALKHSFEKVGDHWEPKGRKGPSDTQAERGAGQRATRTAGGVDAHASKQHLYERARQLDIPGRSSMKQAGARRRVAEGQRPPNGQGPRRIVAEPVGSTLRIEPGAAVSDSADRRNPCPDVTAGHAVIEGTWPWPADKPCGTGRGDRVAVGQSEPDPRSWSVSAVPAAARAGSCPPPSSSPVTCRTPMESCRCRRYPSTR